MKKKVRVKDILDIWEKGGIQGLKLYFNEVEVDRDTWSEKIKKLLKNGYIKSIEEEINLVYFNIKFKKPTKK